MTITMSSAHFPSFPSLHQRHSSFSKPSIGLPTSQLCSFSKPSVTSPTSQLILQTFRRFTYLTAHSPILPLRHIRHRSFSNPFFRFLYVTDSSLTSPSEPPMSGTFLRAFAVNICLYFTCDDIDFVTLIS